MNRFLQISRHLLSTKQRNLESQYSRQGGKGFAAVSNLGQNALLPRCRRGILECQFTRSDPTYLPIEREA